MSQNQETIVEQQQVESVESKKRTKSETNADDDDTDINPKKVRSTRTQRYPLVTRKCRTAYQIYLSEKSKENKRTGGSPKTSSDYGAAWHSEKDKSYWNELAARDLEEYIKEVHAHGYIYEDTKTRKRKSAEEKKPCGQFLLYARDHHKEVMREMGIDYQAALTELGKRWKDGIDPELKQKYVERVEEERRKYAERKASKEQQQNDEQKTNE